jgi:lysine biosynthesis protein LysW
MAKVKMVKCPECQDEFELEDYLEVGDTTFCVSCDTELRVVKLDPPQLEIVAAAEDEGRDFNGNDGNEDEDF